MSVLDRNVRLVLTRTTVESYITIIICLVFLMGQTRPLFVYSQEKYNIKLTINDVSLNGVLGTRTLGGRMVGADESTELWQHPS